jgi:hypothetical protein
MSKYPIASDAASVQAKWTSQRTADGWTKITQQGGQPQLEQPSSPYMA